MDILLTEDIIIDYRVTDADFGIDNSGLEFDVGFENLLGPPVVVVPSNPTTKTEAGVEQTLPDSPPDSSGSPPSSVYSPVDTREHQRKRRRTSDGHEPGNGVVDGTVLCDLMLGQGSLKVEERKDLQSYVSSAGAAVAPGMMTSHNQCPYSTPNAVADDIKPLMGVPETYQTQQPVNNNNNNYHQLTSPTGYYNNYLSEYDPGTGSNAVQGGYVGQPEDLYGHQQHTYVEIPAATTTGDNLTNNSNLAASPDQLQKQLKRKIPLDRSFEDSSPGGAGGGGGGAGASCSESSQYATGAASSSNLNNLTGDGGSTTGDGSLPGTPMQCIRFEPFQTQLWHPLCDHQLQDLPTPHYRVDADKGFNFSASDEAFVCQKKNHFQVTCHTQLTAVGASAAAAPSSSPFNVIFVRTQNGLEKVRNFCLHFYGVKYEAPRHMIRVEQSQSDRSKKVFHPVVIDLHCGQVSKTTVGRLHFSETTSNNMRKKGRPNPEQRYFRLVVALHAHTVQGDYPVVVHGSERIIVRASNPGQFENDFELCWQRGVTPDSIFHNGRIGLNTDQPDECLVVNGNLKVTGHILQPSDCRIKRELTELSTKTQLENIEQIRIVRYAFQDGSGKEPATGVMAQEVRRVLPDAVFEQKATHEMPGGGKVEKFLVVNKDRIFLENVGAVKELNKVTGRLERRIEQLEFGQGELMAATRSRDLSLSPRKVLKGDGLGGRRYSWDTLKLGNHSIQWIIVVLIIVMTVCLSTLATLFFMEHYDAVRHRYYDSMAFRRQEAAEHTGSGAGGGGGATGIGGYGAKHQSMAYSFNYTAGGTANDQLVASPGKPTKKGATYKTDLNASAGTGAGAIGGVGAQSSMSFPPFPPQSHRTGTGNNLSPEVAQQLNWNNLEYSFLYIYKLQQYYNELQKKVKGKVFGTATQEGAGGAGQSASASGDVMAQDSPSRPEDCDSGEAGEPADETNLEGIASSGGDLKLDDEFINRFLTNILGMRNQSGTTAEEVVGPVDEQLKQPKQIPSDKSAIVSEEGHNIPLASPSGGDATTGEKEEQPGVQPVAAPSPAQDTDNENLINSNN